MANPNPNRSGLRPPWQKGDPSPNPSGRPKDLLTMEQVRMLMQRFCRLTKKELQKIVADENSTMIECMVAGVMAKAAQLGDHSRLEFLMARTWGKIKEEIQVHQAYNPILDHEPKENILQVLRNLRGPKTGE